MSDKPKTVLARVTGRVQGVSFRAWTRDTAIGLGLAGWVRNEADGSVSALLSGGQEAVDAMVGQLWQGPPHAQVRDVAISATTHEERTETFRIVQ